MAELVTGTEDAARPPPPGADGVLSHGSVGSALARSVWLEPKPPRQTTINPVVVIVDRAGAPQAQVKADSHKREGQGPEQGPGERLPTPPSATLIRMVLPWAGLALGHP